MKLKKGDIRVLNAEWHSRHGELVEILMKRKGVSKEYAGKLIYHVAYSPLDEEFRKEDFDEEYIESNFKDPDFDEATLLICINDFIENEQYRRTIEEMLDESITNAITKVKELDGMLTYFYLMHGQLWITFGKDKEEAIENMPAYFTAKVKYTVKNKKKKD